MYLKIHETKDGNIVAACDKELIGKVIEDKNGVCIDLDKYRNFYTGKIVGEEELAKALRNFSSVNLVGKKVVAVAVKEGLIDENDIRYINTIPYIQIYQI